MRQCNYNDRDNYSNNNNKKQKNEDFNNNNKSYKKKIVKSSLDGSSSYVDLSQFEPSIELEHVYSDEMLDTETIEFNAEFAIFTIEKIEKSNEVGTKLTMVIGHRIWYGLIDTEFVYEYSLKVEGKICLNNFKIYKFKNEYYINIFYKNIKYLNH